MQVNILGSSLDTADYAWGGLGPAVWYCPGARDAGVRFRTVDATTRHMGREVLHIAGNATVPGSEADAGDRLDRIENLYEEEVDRLLAERMRGEA